MQHTTTYAIFWEPPTLQNGTPSHVSKRYNNLLMGYFNDVGGTELYDNNAQYYDGSGDIMNSSAFGTAWVDTSPYPAATCSYTNEHIEGKPAFAVANLGKGNAPGHDCLYRTCSERE